MGIMTFLQQRAGWLIVGFIGIAIAAFLFSDASRTGGALLNDPGNIVGQVAGEKISYQDYNTRLQNQIEQTKSQYGNTALPPQMMAYINESTWNELVSQVLISKQVANAKLEIGDAEAEDLITGKNPDQRIRQAFTDPKTGVFDANSVRNFEHNANVDKTTKDRFNAFKQEVLTSKNLSKYISLVQGGVYVTSIERQGSLDLSEKRSVNYVVMDYAKIPDAKASLTDAEVEQYYKDHLYEYKSKDNTVNLDYVILHAIPSHQDTLDAKTDISKMIAEFKGSKDDSLFVSINSDSKTPIRYFKSKELSPKLDSGFQGASAGSIIGPYFENGSFKAAKLISVKEMPDSVRSRHILLAPQGSETVEMLQKRADSIKGLLEKGASWANLASTYSADKGSAAKGGELGFVTSGMFVKPFNDFIFNGKKGEIKSVQSQFGVHIIQIEDQKNISKAFEVAQVDRMFKPSTKTVQASYARATSFLGAIDRKNSASLNTEARKQGLNLRSAEDVKATDPTIPGLEQARKVVQWAFGKNNSDISEVFDLGEDFVVAHLVLAKKKGTIPLNLVRRQVEAAALKEKKGELWSKEFVTSTKGFSLEQLAQKLGLPLQKLDSLSFSNPSPRPTGIEPKFIGAVFGAEQGKIAKPIAAERGVYGFVVTSVIPEQIKSNHQGELEKIRSQLKAQSVNAAIEALKLKADVKDNRAQFF